MKCPNCGAEMKASFCSEVPDKEYRDYTCNCGALYCEYDKFYWEAPGASPLRVKIEGDTLVQDK